MDHGGSSREATLQTRIEIPTNLILCRLSSLRPTETTDPAHVADLVRQLRRDGALFCPVHVIERNGEFLLLDGHNRVAGFEELGLASILAQLHEPPIDVRTWVLLSSAAPNTDDLIPVNETEFAVAVDTYGGVIDLHHPAFHLFPAGARGLALQRRQVSHLSAGNGGKDLQRLEDWRRSFSVDEWRAAVAPTQSRSIVIYPRISLGQVFDFVAAGEQMPSAATRFLLRKIVLQRGAALELFKTSTLLGDAVEAVAELIASSGFRVEEVANERT